MYKKALPPPLLFIAKLQQEKKKIVRSRSSSKGSYFPCIFKKKIMKMDLMFYWYLGENNYYNIKVIPVITQKNIHFTTRTKLIG